MEAWVTVLVAKYLPKNRCNRCGSIPTDAGNNVDNELTVKYVS